VWKIEESIDAFVDLTVNLLSNKPLFFLLNSYTTGLSAYAMKYLCDLHIAPRFGGRSEADELGLRVRESGLGLPCGSSVRYTFDE
jgi:23S rRNA (cytosine1962-C5)-methyltransferase